MCLLCNDEIRIITTYNVIKITEFKLLYLVYQTCMSFKNEFLQVFNHEIPYYSVRYFNIIYYKKELVYTDHTTCYDSDNKQANMG
jgi:hypothetical protein